VVTQRATGVTALDVAAKRFGAARFDGVERTVVHRGKRVRCAKRRAKARNDIGEFYSPCRIRVLRMGMHDALLGSAAIGDEHFKW